MFIVYDVIFDAVKSKFLPVTDESLSALEKLKSDIEYLSEDQQNGLLKILFGSANTVVISGNAGSGKTTVQHLASKILAEVFDCEVVKTAAFGIAALNMGGATLSSTFGLMINHVLPFLDDGSAFTYREGERDWGNSMETSYSVRTSAHKVYGKLKRYRKLVSKKPVFWFVDEFSTISSEQFVVCYQLLKRLNPNNTIKLVAFGQPIQMLSPNVNSDKTGLNKHSRAWETAKFVHAGFYTQEDLYPLDPEKPEIWQDERKHKFNYESANKDASKVVVFNATGITTFGSVLINGHGPTVKPNPSWKVLYHNLTTNHRQKEQLEFGNICKAIAEQKPITNDEFWKPLVERINTKTAADFQEKAVWLVRTHARKNSINAKYLKEAVASKPSEAITYHSKIGIAGVEGYIEKVDTKNQIIYLIDLHTKVIKEFFYGNLEYSHRVSNFFNNLTIPVKQVLVPGLPVISRLNSPLFNIANGTVGHVLETKEGKLNVYRPDLDAEQEWEYIVPNYVPATSKGIPFFFYGTLPCHQANAMTFQSCQGLTITSNGVIDIDIEMLKGERGLNSAGAMYVNLTRFTCLDNLLIKVPNDSFSDIHKLNEVIFMDKSSVEFMNFIISMTNSTESTVFSETKIITGNENKTIETKETKTETITETETQTFDPKIYYGAKYNGEKISFIYEGKPSKFDNLPTPFKVDDFLVFQKVEEDDPFDVIIYFEGLISSHQIEDKINSSGILGKFISKGYDLDYFFVLAGTIETTKAVETKPVQIIDIVESSEPSELEILKQKIAEVEAENKLLKEKLSDSVSREEFNELKEKLDLVLKHLTK